MIFRILHLSDLHFKASSVPQDLVLSSLLKKVIEISRQSKINALIITGDIAYSGKDLEYSKAKEFIEKIIQGCKLDLRNIFFIPGNHDVDRAKIKPEHLEWWYRFSNEAALQLVLDSDESLPKIQGSKEAFYSFAQELMHSNIIIGKFGQYVHEMYTNDPTSVKVKVVGLNSALFCGFEGDDKERLALGLEQVSYCEDKVRPDNEVVITCIHHPFQCFHSCETATINVITRFSDIILSGHLHKEKSLSIIDNDHGKVVSIRCGAAYDKRDYQNGFNIIELNLNELIGKAIFYKYLPDEHSWILNKDINHNNDGVFEFKFSKEIIQSPETSIVQEDGSYFYQLVINNELENLTRDKFNSLLDTLRVSFDDPKLQIIKIEKGSTKVYFKSVSTQYQNIEFDLNKSIFIFKNIIEERNSDLLLLKTDKSVTHWKLNIQKDYLKVVESIGANFIHPRVEDLKLMHLYVSPNLKRIKEEGEVGRIDKILSAEDALTITSETPLRVVVYGQETSGKTSLLKTMFLQYYWKGYIPIFLSGSNIKNISEKYLREYILGAFQKQYVENIDINFEDIDEDKIIILLDDFHRIQISKSKYKANLLSNLSRIFKNIVIAANEILQLETYVSKSGKIINILDGFERFSILEYGPNERYELIKRWNGLGRTDFIPNEIIRLNQESENYVDTLIGKNFVPSFPIYLLTILQAKDASISQKPEYSLHGFYYELLINEALNKAVKNKEEISLFYNYITDYCYFLFSEKIKLEPVSIESLYIFHDNYCESYDIKVNLNVVLNTLINSKLLRLSHDDKFVNVSFKYIYYYFTAKYIANNISDDKIRKIVKSLCERVHREEYSSIVMFLTHLSKDQFIIDELLRNSRSLFSDCIPIQLEKDVVFINDIIEKLPKQVYEPLDPEYVKKEELREKEELELQEKEFDAEKDVLSYDLNEDLESLDIIARMTKAMKTIEIVGQVTKKYWGSLKAPQKFELAEETYLLGLRAMSFYYSLIKEDPEILVDYLNSIFKRKNLGKAYSKEIIDKASRVYLFNLCVRAGFGFIKGVTNSIGYEKLAGTFKQLTEVHNFTSVKLIDTSIKLDYNNSFPWEEIEILSDDVKNNFLSKAILQNLVINYLYLFHTSPTDKHKICSILGITMEQQLLIDSTSVIKK